jgi:hypothetical protein
VGELINKKSFFFIYRRKNNAPKSSRAPAASELLQREPALEISFLRRHLLWFLNQKRKRVLQGSLLQYFLFFQCRKEILQLGVGL